MPTDHYRVDPGKAKTFRKRLLKWHKHIDRDLPWRRKKDAYSILISEVMLHQTFARKVIPVYNKFIEEYPTICELAKADIHDIEKMIYPLGLNYRARVLKK